MGFSVWQHSGGGRAESGMSDAPIGAGKIFLKNRQFGGGVCYNDGNGGGVAFVWRVSSRIFFPRQQGEQAMKTNSEGLRFW